MNTNIVGCRRCGPLIYSTCLGAMTLCLLSCERPKNYGSLRDDLAAMVVLIEKQDYSSGRIPFSHAEFNTHYRSVIADFRLVSHLPGSEKCEQTLDALQYFWGRYEQNPDCLLTNKNDLGWLQTLGLANDTNVWMAFDFVADEEKFDSDQAAKAAKLRAVTEVVKFPPGTAAKLETQQAIDDLESKKAYLERRSREWDRILQASALSRDHIYPTYIMGVLLKRSADHCKALLERIR